ncbi:MAG: YbjN domain-containing protein [Gemmataceae bacterium]|nr:YbjN domain-containing protein [Gemmataceae bacterium]
MMSRLLLTAGCAILLAAGAAPCAWPQTPPSAIEKKPQPISVDLQFKRGAKPHFGSIELADGFPTPFRKNLVAGGDQITTIEKVKGWVTDSPDFVLDYKAGKAPLHIYVLSPADTVLFVFGPDGMRAADDDSAGDLNPLVTIKEPRSGQYQIWVGTYEKAFSPATLFISPTLPAPTQKATTEKSIVTSVPDEMLKQLLQEWSLPATQNKFGVFAWKEQDGKDEYRLKSLGRGRVLLISAFFEGPATLERINRWNDRQALCRAVLVDTDGKKTARLEADLNCQLGVSSSGVLGFIEQFKLSASLFREFLQKE